VQESWRHGSGAISAYVCTNEDAIRNILEDSLIIFHSRSVTGSFLSGTFKLLWVTSSFRDLCGRFVIKPLALMAQRDASLGR
jgi:hypothetical protein